MSGRENGKAMLKQIAERAGVSISTVSIVLNGRGEEMRISSATQQRVRECAKEMDYTPNVYARKLRKSARGNGTKVVGIFWSTDFLNESMGEFFFKANRVIQEKHYDIDFSIHFFTPGALEEIQDQLTPWQFNGIIFCGTREKDVSLLEKLDLNIPVVLSNNAASGELNCVFVDNIDVGRRSAQALHDHGYRKVGIFTQHQMTGGAAIRRFGFTSECERLGMTIRPEWSTSVDFSDFAATSREIERIMGGEDRPEALFIASYHSAMSIVVAENGRAERQGDEPAAMMICGLDRTLNVLAQNAAFVNLGIGNYAVNSLDMLWLLMNGGLQGPAKWTISPKIETEKLLNRDR